MGNQQPNYVATYNTWIQYRNNIKSSAPSNLSNKPKSQSTSNGNSMTVSQKTKTNTSQIPMRSVPQISAVRQEYLKNSTASIVGSSHRSSNVQPIKQSQLKRASITQTNPQILKSQLQKQKIVSSPSIPGAQQTILLSNRGNSKEKKIRFPSKIDIIDSFKSQVKATRNKIDLIANTQENQYKWILSEIYNEKMQLMPDRNKMVYLLKEAVDYERLIVGLRTKRQGVVNILNELNEQRYNQQMKGGINEANTYIQYVEKQFTRIDWKNIILEAPTNIQRYIEVINSGIADTIVQQSFAQISAEVQSMRPPPPPPQIQTPIVQPEPTNTLPQSQIKFQKAMQQNMGSSSLKQQAASQALVDKIFRMSIDQKPQSPIKIQSLSSSQQINIKTSILNSSLRQSQNLNSFGLQVTTPSMIRTTLVDTKTPGVTSEQQKQQQNNKTKLSQIKNIDKSSNVKTVNDQSVKPVINGFQSSVKPPPNYNAFSMPQSLLK